MPPAAIRIRPGKAGRLIVDFPYSAERVARMRTVPGRLWHDQEKHWTVPDTDQAPDAVRAAFAGESVELVLPEHLPLLDGVRRAAQTRHYSRRTEETYAGWIERFLWIRSPVILPYDRTSLPPEGASAISIDSLCTSNPTNMVD